MTRGVVALALVLFGSPSVAASPAERARDAELERVRARVADQVQLTAYDLLDELVYGMTQAPPFERETPVILAALTVPIGLGSGLQALAENHLSGLLIQNPTSRIQLVHCPACTQVVVHSGPEATTISRGIDDPAFLADLARGGERHALFVDLEAEGSSLVLRARITKLDPNLPVIWTRTLATDGSVPGLLRAGDDLKSAAEARSEYLAALRDRGPVAVVGRAGVRTYARSEEGDPETGQRGTPPPPFLWVNLGAELSPTDDQDWLASITIGGSFIPQAYQGILIETRIERLLTGRARSHVRPDLYFFATGGAMTVWGDATAGFQTPTLTTADILNANQGRAPRFILGYLGIGLDLRLGNRIGLGGYLENVPYVRNSANIGTHIRPFGIGFHSLGLEASLWF
jgi:hypothetical protein